MCWHSFREQVSNLQQTLRISVDAKATVNLGPFARGGKRRVPTEAVDHDVQPEAKVTPVGILMPTTDALFVYGVTSKVPSDCLVDRVQEWWDEVCARMPHSTTLVLNRDNGPENHSRRTQCIQRLVTFVTTPGSRCNWPRICRITAPITTTRRVIPSGAGNLLHQTPRCARSDKRCFSVVVALARAPHRRTATGPRCVRAAGPCSRSGARRCQ